MKITWMAALLAGLVLLGGCGKKEKLPEMTQPVTEVTEEALIWSPPEETEYEEFVPELEEVDEAFIPALEEAEEITPELLVPENEAMPEEGIPEAAEEASAETPAQLPQGAAVGKVMKEKTVNLRQGPSVNSNIVKKVKLGEQVTILEGIVLDGVQWAHVDGGWMCLDYLEVSGTIPAPKGKEDGGLPGVVMNTKTLNVRSEPDGTAEKVGQLKGFDVIMIYETQNGWGRTDGGWVSLQYVNMQKEGAELSYTRAG